MRCELGSPSRAPLRPGMRCEMVRPLPDPRAHRISMRTPRSPWARRDLSAHPIISGRIPRSPGAHPMISGCIPRSPRSHPRTRPAGPPIRGLLASQQRQDRGGREDLRQVEERVGPGSPLSLRPGMRCETVRSQSDPRARRDLHEHAEISMSAPGSLRASYNLWAHPKISRGASYDLWAHPTIPPVASPDKAREGRRSGAHSLRSNVKIAFHNKCLRRAARRVGPCVCRVWHCGLAGGRSLGPWSLSTVSRL